MTTCYTIDQLFEAVGHPPFPVQRLVDFYDEWEKQNTSNFTENTPGIVEKIELLDVLVSAGLEMYGVQKNSEADYNLITDFLQRVIPRTFELKQAHLGNEPIISQEADPSQTSCSGLARTCQYCNWALQRIGSGLLIEGKPDLNRIIVPNRVFTETMTRDIQEIPYAPTRFQP